MSFTCLNYGESVMASFRQISLNTTDGTVLVEITNYIVHSYLKKFFLTNSFFYRK